MTKYSGLFFFVFLSFTAFAQEQKDDIGVQEVTVIKSYTPSLQDVYKLRQSPTLVDSVMTKKKTPDYAISSVPVASTFVPSKGAARKLQPKKAKVQFDSKASLGFGNFNQLQMEYSTNFSLDRRQTIDWLIHYNGVLKNIEGIQLNSQQANLLLNLSHRYSTSKRTAFSQINFRQHQQAFYGLRNPIEDEFIQNNINPKQHLNYLTISSQWQWYEPWVKQLELHSYLTTDSFGTSEVEIDFSSKIQMVFSGLSLTLLPEITYLTSHFKEDFYSRLPMDYQSGNARLTFFASKINGNFKFKVGAKGVLGIGDEFADERLFIYPTLALSYRPKKGNFAPFIKLDGSITQNSFRSFSHENPYVAPAMRLKASSVPYDVQIGTRSKFFAGWEFQWNLFYQTNDNQPIYRSLGRDIDRTNIIAYRYDNAFEVFYANMANMGVEAQLSAAFKNGGRLQFKARYADFSFDATDETTPEHAMTAFNMPHLSLVFNGTLKIGQKMYFQWYIKHLGERQNAYRDNFIGQDLENAPVLTEDLSSFTQLDTNLHYQLNERWELYLKGKNILNQATYQWSQYPVYGTQFLVGMRYNFDLSF